MAGSTTWLSLALLASACGAAESMPISVPAGRCLAGPWLAPAVASAAQATGLQLLLLRNEFPFHALLKTPPRCGGPAARAPGDSPGAEGACSDVVAREAMSQLSTGDSGSRQSAGHSLPSLTPRTRT